MRDEPSPSQSGLCAEYRERLPLYVGGDLDSTELDAIAQHLAGCETCAAEAARASGARNAFVDSLQGWRSEFATEEGRAELWPSIRDRLVAEGLLESDTLRLVSPVSSRRRLRLLRPAGLVAAAAAIIFLVVRRILHALRGLGHFGNRGERDSRARSRPRSRLHGRNAATGGRRRGDRTRCGGTGFAAPTGEPDRNPSEPRLGLRPGRTIRISRIPLIGALLSGCSP